jgi:hypothetical protein
VKLTSFRVGDGPERAKGARAVDHDWVLGMVQQWKCNLSDTDEADDIGVEQPSALPVHRPPRSCYVSVVDENVQASSRVVDDAESVSDRRVVTHVQLVELATERGCCRYSTLAATRS